MVTDSRTPLGTHTLRPLNAPVLLWVRADAVGRPLEVRRDRWSRPRTVAALQDGWRIDDEWWREQPISRLYYTLRLEDDLLITVYHDLVAGAWFEQRATKAALPPPRPRQEAPAGRQPRRKPPAYVELHLHTCYSFLEGASRPEELAVWAARMGYPALAVTDRDGLYGAMEFAQACAEVDIRSITGAELTLRHGLHDTASGPVSLVLLAQSRRGYANLCRLITQAHRSSPRDAVALDPSFLEGHTEGLIALSGGRSGEIDRLVAAGRLAEARQAARRLARHFDRQSTFIELQHNLVEGDARRMTM